MLLSKLIKHIKTFILKVFCFRKINHYIIELQEIDLEKLDKSSVKEKFEHKIYSSYYEIEKSQRRKIEEYFGEAKISSFKIRFGYGHLMVISSLDGHLCSFCFFATSNFKFTNFRLKEKELYFYDCYTFPEFRGKGAIFSEVKRVLEIYKQLGYKKAHVEIDDTNNSSKKAFTKIGFKLLKVYYCFGIFSICFQE